MHTVAHILYPSDTCKYVSFIRLKYYVWFTTFNRIATNKNLLCTVARTAAQSSSQNVGQGLFVNVFPMISASLPDIPTHDQRLQPAQLNGIRACMMKQQQQAIARLDPAAA